MLQIELPPNEINVSDFGSWTSIRGLRFPSNSACWVIDGVRNFCALSQVVIPRSVEKICWSGFAYCLSLTDVILE
jgi:hypothetical protein